jgi:hypothetical protein
MGMACNYFSTYFRISRIPFGAVRAFSALHPREIQFVNADSPVSLSRVVFIAVNSKICVTDSRTTLIDEIPVPASIAAYYMREEFYHRFIAVSVGTQLAI